MCHYFITSIFHTKIRIILYASLFVAQKTYASHCRNSMRVFADIHEIRNGYYISGSSDWYSRMLISRPFQIEILRERDGSSTKLERTFRHVRAHNDQYVGETNSIFGVKLVLLRNMFPLTGSTEYRILLLRVTSFLMHFSM